MVHHLGMSRSLTLISQMMQSSLQTISFSESDTLWRIFGLRRVPPKLIDVISELHSGTESAVKCGGTISH